MFNIVEIPQKPIFQALICAVLTAIAFIILKIIGASQTIDPNLYWILGGTSILLFTVLNTTYGTRADNMKQYWFHSVYSFIALFLFSLYAPKFLSGISIGESPSFGKIYIVLVFCYFLFFSMTMIIKRLWLFFEAENDAKLRKDGMR
jgi:hypothetical protein